MVSFVFSLIAIGDIDSIRTTVVDLVPVPDSALVERGPEIYPLLWFRFHLFSGDLGPFRGEPAPDDLPTFPANLPGDASEAAVLDVEVVRFNFFQGDPLSNQRKSSVRARSETTTRWGGRSSLLPAQLDPELSDHSRIRGGSLTGVIEVLPAEAGFLPDTI